jgi:hypothetical protein
VGGPRPHLSVYRVTGPLRYREHSPGDVFEAVLEPDVEKRAVALGAIRVIDSTPPRIKPGSWTLPTKTTRGAVSDG